MAGFRIHPGPLIHIVFIQGAPLLAPIVADLLAFRSPVFRNLGDHVLVVRAVDRDIPGEIALLENVHGQVEFEALVHHVHVVDQLRRRFSLGKGKRTIVNHVLGLLDEILDVKVEATPELALDADVQVVGFLPGHIRSGTENLGQRCGALDAVDAIEVLIYAGERELLLFIQDGVISLRAVTGPEAQRVDPVDIPHESFILGIPRSADGPETAPSLVRGEAGRGVHTIGCR